MQTIRAAKSAAKKSKKAARAKALVEIFKDDLFLKQEEARVAAKHIEGKSIDDLAEILGSDLAVSLCVWIAKVSGLRECENCGNYEWNLVQRDGCQDMCEQCDDDTAEDREDEEPGDEE